MTETTDGNIYAPWDMQTVRNLNRFQSLSFVHPFTCGNDQHSGQNPKLVAGPNGWRCPDPRDEGCEYTQNWAHAFMADPDKWPHGPTPEFWRQRNVMVSKAAAEAVVDARVAAERLVAILSNETLGKITAELVDTPANPAEVVEALRWCCNGNAEECVLCTGTNPPYPFICPGDHPYTPQNRRKVLVAATDEGREAQKAAMKRLRIYAELNKGVEDDEEAETDEMANEALKRAAQRAKTAVKHLDEVSAVRAWAEDDDLAEALGSFGDGYRHAQRDALRALGIDSIAAREGQRLLSCGICWTEFEEEIHPHLECHHGYKSPAAGTYQHYKGGTYVVLETVRHSERDERLVLYRGEDDSYWVRPLHMFHDYVRVNGSLVPRFRFISASVDGTDADELDLPAMRKLASERLLAIALERTEREWICCDPIDVSHPLCVQGEATRTMLKALLTDDETVFPPSSDFLDEVMRLVQGIGDYRMERSVLSEAEVRELYRGSLQQSYEDRNAGVGWMTMEKLVDSVVAARDRELARNRQRLSLADQAAGMFIRDHEAHDKSVEEASVIARREERVKVLDEVLAKIHGEICSPIEGIAFHSTILWLKKAKRTAAE